mgnify:CR=1 FL=1
MGLGKIETTQNTAAIEHRIGGAHYASQDILMAPSGVFVGGWAHIGSFVTKTLMCQSIGATGSLYIVLGMAGTEYRTGRTGTYYQTRLGVGSFSTFTFTEQARYLKALYQRGAAAGGVFSLVGLFQT